MTATLELVTTREKLMRVVLDLPDQTLDRALAHLEGELEDPVIVAFRDAPEDDEPWTDEDEAAAAAGRADIAAGRVASLQEIKREFGL